MDANNPNNHVIEEKDDKTNACFVFYDPEEKIEKYYQTLSDWYSGMEISADDIYK